MLGSRWNHVRFSTRSSGSSENREKVSCQGAGPQTDLCAAAGHPCLGSPAEIQPSFAAVPAESDLPALDNVLARRPALGHGDVGSDVYQTRSVGQYATGRLLQGVLRSFFPAPCQGASSFMDSH